MQAESSQFYQGSSQGWEGVVGCVRCLGLILIENELVDGIWCIIECQEIDEDGIPSQKKGVNSLMEF